MKFHQKFLNFEVRFVINGNKKEKNTETKFPTLVTINFKWIVEDMRESGCFKGLTMQRAGPS